MLIQYRNMFLFLLSLVCSAYANPYDSTSKTAMAVKQNIHNYNDSIPIDTANFIELARKSKLFVDNTLFIKEIIQLNGSTLILCPQSWGKTTLLTMLQAYLQIEVDAQGNAILPEETRVNYRLFNKGEIVLEDGAVQKLETTLLIARQEKSLESHHGKFPVIYLTFKDTLGESYENVKRNMALAIGRAFKQHDYMIKVLETQIQKNNSDLEKIHLEQFQKYINIGTQPQITMDDVIFGLSRLSDILHHHFQKPSYILIDDYDVPIHSYLKYHNLSNKQVNEISHLMEYFLIESTTKRYHNQCVCSVLTGTFQMVFNESYHNHTFNIMDNRELPMHEYFGFKQAHALFLFEKHGIEETLAQQALCWYNGYVSKSVLRAFYNTKSVVHFLHHRKIASYRSADTFTYFVRNILEIEPNQKNWLLGSLSKDHLQFSQIRDNETAFDSNFRFYLHEADQKFDIYRYRKLLLKVFLAILKTEVWPKETTQGRIHVVVNSETTFVIAQWMISYYKHRYLMNDQHLDNAANALHYFITGISTNTTSLTEHLQNVYTTSTCDINENEHCEQSPAHAILNCIGLRMQCMTAFKMDVYYKSLRNVDLVIHDHEKRQGVVVILQREPESAKLAYQEALKANVADSLPKIRRMQVIGINVNSDKIVDIMTTSFKV